ncbi:hypothetical protein FQR65_LT15717 [Abscondita terminalis]|nr:hypothetical protein FQR65_LT15717 [Abscondita terminalis]
MKQVLLDKEDRKTKRQSKRTAKEAKTKAYTKPKKVRRKSFDSSESEDFDENQLVDDDSLDDMEDNDETMFANVKIRDPNKLTESELEEIAKNIGRINSDDDSDNECSVDLAEVSDTEVEEDIENDDHDSESEQEGDAMDPINFSR